MEDDLWFSSAQRTTSVSLRDTCVTLYLRAIVIAMMVDYLAAYDCFRLGVDQHYRSQSLPSASPVFPVGLLRWFSIPQEVALP